MSDDVLPDSRARTTRGIVFRNGEPWIPIFCANCGADGGHVPEASKTFAFYICVPCGEKWAPLAGTMLVPDEVFWAKVKEEQIERYGRELTGDEVAEALKDPQHVLSKLAKDRPR